MKKLKMKYFGKKNCKRKNTKYEFANTLLIKYFNKRMMISYLFIIFLYLFYFTYYNPGAVRPEK